MSGIRETPAPVWQPIATAPKDGTRVRLAWNQYDWTTADGMFREGQWVCAPLFFCDGKSKPGQPYLEFRECRIEPILWMPNPPPPVISGANLADATP